MTWRPRENGIGFEDVCSWCGNPKAEGVECCEDRMGAYEAAAAAEFPGFADLPARDRGPLIDRVKDRVDLALDYGEGVGS